MEDFEGSFDIVLVSKYPIIDGALLSIVQLVQGQAKLIELNSHIELLIPQALLHKEACNAVTLVRPHLVQCLQNKAWMDQHLLLLQHKLKVIEHLHPKVILVKLCLTVFVFLEILKTSHLKLAHLIVLIELLLDLIEEEIRG